MVGHISALLIGLGLVLLGASIWRTQRLIGILQDKHPWPSLRNLMGFFAVGYAVYLYAIITHLPLNKDLVAGEIFFLTALFMLLVVHYAYQTIHDIMRLDELKQIANTDELTGMYSRRAILALLDDEFQKARRFGFPLSVAMVDLDQFKAVNDTYSHLAGDVVLREVARVLQTRLRKFDVLGRYGGDEFLCVLPGTGVTGAMSTGERVRSRVNELQFEIIAPDKLRVLETGTSTDSETLGSTISVGVATLHPGIQAPLDLVQEADAALYASKEGGRNTVSSAPLESDRR
ncbi:GGDEF domain-containing protein [Gemmatimonadota bacterium]